MAGLAALMFGSRRHFHYKSIFTALAILLVLTIIFDSLIIHYGIVAYDSTKILGIYIAKAPIEDFAYTVAVVFVVPFLWRLYGNKTD
jgi:lycopene cyclase domain-containing protein